MQSIHRQLSSRGFFSQFVGSMIQYRHPRQPELSVGLSVDENPWRAAGKHGEFRFQLTNTTFVPDAAVQEDAQGLLNDLMKAGLDLHGNFDVSQFKGAIAPDAMRAMHDACQSGQGLHDASKTYLKAIHDALKENTEGENRPERKAELKKQKAAVPASKKRK